MQNIVKMKDWASKTSASKNRLYGVVQNKGRLIEHYFVLINPLKEAIFLKYIKDGAKFNLNDVGEIVAKGYGNPSEELKEELRKKYNADLK